MSKFTTGPTTEKRRQDELDFEDEQEEQLRNAPRACEAFEVDLAAREFGTCKCGFKKHDHVQGYRAGPRAIAQPAAFTHEPRRSSLSEEQQEEDEQEEEVACDAYVIDMSAAEFGTCKCGKKKTAHTKAALFAKPKSSGGFSTLQANAEREKEERARDAERERKRKEEEARSREEFLERERKILGEGADQYLHTPQAVAEAAEEEPKDEQPQCAAYELDMQAAKFGTCRCGRAKTEHTREALNAKPVQTHRRSSVLSDHGNAEEEEDQGPKACDAFELDMSAAEFGTCKCGFKKTQHSKDALFAKPPASRPAVARPAPAFETATKVAAAAVAAPVVAAPPPRIEVKEEEPPAPAVVEQEQQEPEVQALGDVLDPPHMYRALFDFEGQEAEDLPFREGDLIEVVEIIDADWLRGRIGQTIGVFPRSYAEEYQEQAVAAEEPAYEEEAPAPVEEPVFEEQQQQQPVAEEPSGEFPFTVYAQFDFESENEGDLALRTGDVVTVLEYVDDQWWRGQANGQEGIFPADFVAKEAPPPAAMEEQSPYETVGVEEPLGSSGLGYVIAQFDFEAENEGDLSFQQGDRIEVLETIDENWMRGALHGNEGILPVSYVSEIMQ